MNLTFKEGIETMERAINIYGEKSQILVAIEEFSELTKALCKCINRGESPDNVLEEIADAVIMLEQCMLMFGNPSEIIEKKLLRLRERLDNEQHTGTELYLKTN